MAVYQQGTSADYQLLLDILRDFVSSDHVDSAIVNAAGTGYAVADIVTVTPGTFHVACTVEVLTVGGSGEVLTFKVRQSGGYTVIPSPLTNVATTVVPSGGTSFTMDLTMTGVLWTVSRDQDNNHQTGEVEMQFEGVGNGADEIFVGIRSFNVGGSRNWELGGFTGFDSGLTWESQPGKSPGSFTTSGAFVPLTESSTMNYWFNVTGRRIIFVINVNTGYASGYLGWLNQFATTAEYPYPLLIMGSSSEDTILPGDTIISYSGISDPVSDNINDNGPGAIRSLDGNWYTVRNSTGNTSGRVPNSDRVVMPAGTPSAAIASEGDLWYVANTRQFDDFIPLFGSPGAPTLRMPPSLDSGGDIYNPLPCTLNMSSPATILMGELDDVFHVFAENGMIAEDTLDDTNLTIFQCGNRSEAWAHFAMRTSE